MGTSCPKCRTLNEEKLTRCRNCNAILPAKMEVVQETYRAPVTVAKVNTAGLTCARCGAENPYSRFKCGRCGASLTQYKGQSLKERAFVYLGTAILLVLAGAALARNL